VGCTAPGGGGRWDYLGERWSWAPLSGLLAYLRLKWLQTKHWETGITLSSPSVALRMYCQWSGHQMRYLIVIFLSGLCEPLFWRMVLIGQGGSAIAKAVSCRLPTAAARVRTREFVVDKVARGQVFSEYFGFPCQSSFHELLHNHHHLSSGGWYNRPVVATVPRGLSLTPLRVIRNK
jgi:hypothetical protein